MASETITSSPSSSPPSLPPISPPSDLPVDAIAPVVALTDTEDSLSTSEPEAGSIPLPPGLSDSTLQIPIPTVSPSADSVSFSYSDPNATDPQAAYPASFSILCRPLPPESAGADIVIASDSSYVETSSAPCAIELKRRYDALYGVNITVRSPYAITAFVGQHGQKRFRVGHRDMSAPGASAAAAEELLVSKSPPPSSSSKSPQSSRSIGGRSKSNSNSTKSPTGSIIKAASKASLPTENASPRPSHQAKSESYSRASKVVNGKRHSKRRISINALLGSGTPAVPSTSVAGSSSLPSSSGRKLKKPRSNPDLSLSYHSANEHRLNGNSSAYAYGPSSNATGRMHSLSVTATDMPHVLGIDRTNSSGATSSTLLANKPSERKGDTFGQVMGWTFTPQLSSSSTNSAFSAFSVSAPSTGYASHSTQSLFFEPSNNSNSDASPPVGTSAGSGTGGVSGFVPRPFGPSVHFEYPAVSHPKDPTAADDYDFNRFLNINNPTRALREMQSFESGLTATPLPPITPTGPLEACSRRLEVDLGGDISLGDVDFGEIVDLALNQQSAPNKANGKGRVIEKQKSAIHLTERERDKKADVLETIHDVPAAHPSGSTATFTTPDTAYTELSSPDFNSETSTSHSASDLSSTGDLPSSNFSGAEPSTTTPRVQMYSPPGLPPRLAKFTTYSTDIFDVLQTSRGLPRLDLFAEDTDSDDPSSISSTPLPETVPVKLSLSQDNSAAPKDDPRFVIWGEVGRMSPGEVYGFGDGGSSHETSSAQSSTKGKGRASDTSFSGSRGMDLSSSSSEDGSRARVLLAATIERWLAQLTSDLDYDELLNFFLTYRTYISALDLARLLMARFCWALGTRGSTTPSTTDSADHEASADIDSDDIARRIVRVRTFVAFKYWLITFFTVDFVPNRELRLFVASHLNELGEELRELQKDVCKGAGDLGRQKREQIEREMGMSRGAIIDGVSIVKKLKKVAKDCKQLYTHNNATTSATSQAQRAPLQSQSQSFRKSVSLSRGDENLADNRREHLFGAKFAEATRKLSAASTTNPTDADDSDVDLDFLSDEPVPSMVTPFSGAPVNNVNLGGASTLNLSPTLSPPGPGSIPLSSFSILQRTDHAPGPEGFTHMGSSMSSGIYSANTNGPIPHNALSRVLVKTLGRLGRWKRVLNSGGVAHGANMHRSITTGGLGKSHPGIGFTRMAAACADVSAFDVELTVDSSDLLSSSEGVESYLRLVETQKTSLRKHVQEPPALASTMSPPKVPASLSATNPTTPAASPAASPMVIAHAEEKTSPRQSVALTLGQSIDLDPSEIPVQASLLEDNQSFSDRSAVLQHRHSTAETVSDYGVVSNVYEAQDSAWSVNEEPFNNASSSRESRATLSTRRTSGTSSTDSFGEPISANRASARFPAFTSPWQFDVVSLDELSDNSSDERTSNAVTSAPTMPPGLRRPPRRLPLRREFEFLERPETVSSMGIISRSSIVSASSASGQSTVSRASTSSAIGGLGGGIHQWQMNALKDSLTDDEEPGDVDEALKRLEGQINPQKQLEKVSKVNGWVQTMRQRLAAGDYSDEEPMYSDDDEADIEDEDHASVDSAPSPKSQNADPSTPLSDVETETPVVTLTDQVASPARSTDAKPALEDVVPLEILQSRVSSEQPSTTPEKVSVTSKFVDPGPKAHRSFVLMFKAEDLAQHFAMIDRELFMTIKFEELLLDDWMYCEEVDALEWAQFLKDRARWKAESRWPEKTSALGAVRARFNLMVNFTISEIVLTNQAERPYVFSKFLRIAWKSYQRSSFNTLVAIMIGLQSDWVKRAMRKSMHRLAVWDNRLLTDFKVFTSSEDNFRHIRSAIDAINDAKPLETTSRAPSVVNSGGNATDKTTTPTACVPFIGAYLSQLYQYNQLPVLIDPTAPNEVVTFDPVSSNLSSPAHPEVFSTLTPLPSSMNLEPLINVHRQRLIAAVIKSLVAGQHLASRVQFPIDKKLFHKCLRIRGLDSNTLHRALVMLPH